MALSIGEILDDRYVLLQRLGEGGQGEVWKALDRLPPNRNVALKVIDLERTSASGLERLRREAAALHKLSHPSLVPCMRAFEDLSRNLFGLVLEYVEGSNVDVAMADGRFTAANRKWVLAHLASVLWYLHERGLVHRDLKPENVLLDAAFWRAPERPEHLKLIDLGIAAVEGNPRPMTDPGRVIGTAPYMAPEVIDPEVFRAPIAGPTRDVFSFGVMGWVLLAGRHPSGLEEGISGRTRAPTGPRCAGRRRGRRGRWAGRGGRSCGAASRCARRIGRLPEGRSPKRSRGCERRRRRT
jgi:serine/threonine protein kinase